MGIDLVTVLDYDSLELLKTHAAICEVKMLYVPTLSLGKSRLPCSNTEIEDSVRHFPYGWLRVGALFYV
jgi:hypothetical protein